MATVTHTFVSAITDDATAAAAGEVLPSHWNANHTVSLVFGDVTGALGYTPTNAAVVPSTAPSAGQIPVGNAGGTAYAPVAVSGDATLASTGAVTLATVNSNVGSFTNASITVDAKGRVTAASTGTGGGGSPGGSGTEIQYRGGASTFSAVPNSSVSTNGMPTWGAGTITASDPFTLTQTWNSSGVTFTGFKLNVTSTASAAASLLLDLQVAGTSVFNVTKAGSVSIADNSSIQCAAASTSNVTFSSGGSNPTTTVQGGSSGKVIVNASALELQARGTNGFIKINASNGLSMSTGAAVGGAVTQTTSKATGVTLNTPTGQITTNNAALAANAIVTFTVTNSTITAVDNIMVNLISGNATAGTYHVWAEKSAAGSFVMCVHNVSAGSLSEALVIQFTRFGGAAS